MIKDVKQPVKVIDDFFEAPTLVRHSALKLDYLEQDNDAYYGLRSKTLDEINFNLFDTILAKLIVHVPNKYRFNFVHCDFNLVDSKHTSEIVELNGMYNIAGTIFLNPNPPENSGITFYSKVSNAIVPSIKVENVFNRCVIFEPEKPHKIEKFYGETKEDSSLFINFYGVAVHD